MRIGSVQEKLMKKTLIALFCLAAGAAWADDDGEAATESISEVELRVSVFENIDVTAEKPPSASVEEPDADIAAILEEAEALEEDDESE